MRAWSEQLRQWIEIDVLWDGKGRLPHQPEVDHGWRQLTNPIAQAAPGRGDYPSRKELAKAKPKLVAADVPHFMATKPQDRTAPVDARCQKCPRAVRGRARICLRCTAVARNAKARAKRRAA